MCLIKLLARLVDEDGRMSLLRRPVDPGWLKESRDVPLTQSVIRAGAHLLHDVQPLPDRDLSPAAWIWRQPAVTILSTTLPLPGHEKNAIRKRASARLSVRLAPGQKKDEMMPVSYTHLDVYKRQHWYNAGSRQANSTTLWSISGTRSSRLAAMLARSVLVLSLIHI